MTGKAVKYSQIIDTPFTELTQYGLIPLYGDIDMGQNRPNNAFLPDGDTLLPEPILIYIQGCSVAFTWE